MLWLNSQHQARSVIHSYGNLCHVRSTQLVYLALQSLAVPLHVLPAGAGGAHAHHVDIHSLADSISITGQGSWLQTCS